MLKTAPAAVLVMLVPAPKVMAPDSVVPLPMAMPPPLPAIVFAAPVKLYVPELPLMVMPVALNVAPVAPVSVPEVTPHVPVTAVRVTPFVSPVELTLAKVPLTAPVVRFRAVAPDTLTAAPIDSVPKVAPLIAVVEPVN